jgi:hypothetical protein
MQDDHGLHFEKFGLFPCAPHAVSLTMLTYLVVVSHRLLWWHRGTVCAGGWSALSSLFSTLLVQLALTGYPAEYPVSGFWISRISGWPDIRQKQYPVHP